MERMAAREVADTVQGLNTLKRVMCEELHAIDQKIGTFDNALLAEARVNPEDFLNACHRARSNILGGLASIDEVLGWIHLLAEHQPDGTELDIVRTLPQLYELRER